jgi:hypothetical protein
MNPDLHDLYAGLAGVRLAPERFDLGEGVTISQTYAHFMAPFLMAFSPAPPGKPHPTPWRSAKGGYSIDITAEIFLPSTCKLEKIDRLNTIWWIVALLRLKATAGVYVPVVSSERFKSVALSKAKPELWPVEIHTHRLKAEIQTNPLLDISELEWLKSHWRESIGLLSNEDFNFAVQAVDGSICGSNPRLALVAVWGALERLFSANSQELSFRVSANIASYLEPPGGDRHKCFKHVKSLYNQRSKAAHGDGEPDVNPYVETFSVAKRALLKMVEVRHVPSKTELEAGLFGDDVST